MPQRGSEKLRLSAESLKSTLAAAKIDLSIERWWKYGQPQIDRVSGIINVGNVANTGKVVQELLGVLSREINGTIEVFPYGIINPEGARINVTYELEVD
ncbi:MAG TPA: hypothetical protein VFB76_03630 [Candidatus Angelobacter sp.]|nr:hypothetical protein [Candidatus Angelobacter sp.]